MDTVSVQKPGKERVCYIDCLRIIACFFVIVNHTNSELFLEREPTLTWFCSLTYFFFSKTAVPVFLMISGFTMLDKHTSHKDAASRAFRYGCSLVVFSGAYYLFGEDISNRSLENFFVILRTQPVCYTFWYMYVYLGVLLMMPFLQKMAAAFTKEDYHAMFFWSGLIHSVWPIVGKYLPVLSMEDQLFLPLFESYLVMLFLGSYFKKYCKPSPAWRIPCAAGFLGTSLLSMILTYSEYVRNSGVDFLFFDNRQLLPIILSSVCLFGFVSTLEFRGPVRDLCESLGKLTFGIYMISNLLIEKLRFIYDSLAGYFLHMFVAMVVYELAIFAVGAGIIWCLRKLPVVKKLL